MGIIKSLISLFNANDFAYELFYLLFVSLAILLLFNILSGLFNCHQIIKLCIKIVVSLSVILPVYKFLNLATEYMYDISVFLGILAPTVGTVTAFGGNIFSAEIQGFSFSVLTVICQVLLNYVLPLVTTFYVVVSVIDVFGKEGRMLAFSQFARNFLFGAYTLFIALVFMIINFYNSAAVGQDSVSSRAFKLLLGQSIPIIGRTVSEAIKLLGSGIISARNVIGLSSIIFVLGMCMPYVPVLIAYSFILNFFAFLCDYFSVPELKGTLLHLKNAVEFVIATFAVMIILIFINIGVFMNTIPLIIQ